MKYEEALDLARAVAKKKEFSNVRLFKEVEKAYIFSFREKERENIEDSEDIGMPESIVVAKKTGKVYLDRISFNSKVELLPYL